MEQLQVSVDVQNDITETELHQLIVSTVYSYYGQKYTVVNYFPKVIMSTFIMFVVNVSS